MRTAIVIGAGVVGLCAADALVRRGFQVTVLERDARSGDGASHGNGGIVVPSHFEPLANPGNLRAGIRMLRSKESPFGFSATPNWETLEWMARFAAASTKAHVERCAPLLRDLNLASRALFEERYEAFQSGYCRRGELMICRTPKELEAETHLAAEAQRLGLQTQVLDAQELSAFETGIQVEASGAVYFQDDAHLTPSAFMKGLLSRLLSNGVKIREGAEVSEFRVSDGRVESAKVSAEKGDSEEMEADQFVLASGAWTGHLARKLGLKIPMLAGKGYGFTVANPPATPKYPAILVAGRVAVTPMLDGVRFVGTMEIGPPETPSVNPKRLDGMQKAIRAAYPAFRDLNLPENVWAGLRPCPPDGMPYLGRTRKFQNLIVAAGHGMMGMSLGPISGELVGQIAEGRNPTLSLSLLSPDRYA